MNSLHRILACIITILVATLTMSAQTQAQMNEEAARSYKRADRELNSAYKDVMKLLSKEKQDKLRAAQRNWIKYRDSSCEREASDYKDGSMYPLIYTNCLEEKTRERTQYFWEMLDAMTEE